MLFSVCNLRDSFEAMYRWIRFLVSFLQITVSLEDLTKDYGLWTESHCNPGFVEKEKKQNDITCLKYAVSCTQLIVVILFRVFLLKGLQKCGHGTGLHERSLKFLWLDMPDAGDVQQDILQTWELILKNFKLPWHSENGNLKNFQTVGTWRW